MSDAAASSLGDGAAGSIVLAGAGKMGGAMLWAWLDAGIAPERLAVVEPQPSEDVTARLSAAGVALNPNASTTSADILVLAVKPQALEAAGPMLSSAVSSATVLVSVVAGKTIADLRRAFPQAGVIVRAMPNTPAAIRQGITGVAAEPQATATQRAAVQRLLEAVGQVEWLPDESLIDAVTALSGSGPAYVFYLTECLTAAGRAAGLDPALAARLARATVSGAGALMAAERETPPEVLRRNVTSPGGTTAAALDVLMAGDGLSALMGNAVAAAKRRAGELSG